MAIVDEIEKKLIDLRVNLKEAEERIKKAQNEEKRLIFFHFFFFFELKQSK